MIRARESRFLAPWRQPLIQSLSGLLTVILVFGGLTGWLLPNVSAILVAIVDIDQSAGSDAGINLREVAHKGDVMYGETVTVSARVQDRVGPHAVVIGTDHPIFGVSVPVLSAEPMDTLAGGAVREGRVLEVTGEVQPCVRSLLRQRLGTELDRGIADQCLGQPVILAESLLVNPPFAYGPGDKEFPAGSDGWDLVVTINDVLDEPQQLISQRVTVSGEIEEGLRLPNAFLLGDRKLLIISLRTDTDLVPEATAYATGEVRFLDADEIELEFGINLDDERLEFFAGDPVVIADEIQVVK